MIQRDCVRAKEAVRLIDGMALWRPQSDLLPKLRPIAENA
jgi:hypothetical protein